MSNTKCRWKKVVRICPLLTCLWVRVIWRAKRSRKVTLNHAESRYIFHVAVPSKPTVTCMMNECKIRVSLVFMRPQRVHLAAAICKMCASSETSNFCPYARCDKYPERKYIKLLENFSVFSRSRRMSFFQTNTQAEWIFCKIILDHSKVAAKLIDCQ